MSHIVACIDGSVYSESVADHAAWAGTRLDASVELLQVLGRREPPPADLSGSLRADASAHLLEELAAVDAERAKLVQKRARLLMGEAKARVEAGGVAQVGVTLRQGDLLDAVAEREGKASLIVVGKRGEGADFARMHLGSNLERLVRAARRPVLVASRAFRPIRRALIAYDGGAAAQKAVDHIARSPLFADIETHLVTVGTETEAARRAIDDAAARLADGGRRTRTHLVPGAPDEAIAALVADLGVDLLVMGAYGHTRVRNLFIGSTTTEMIRSCLIPVMLFR